MARVFQLVRHPSEAGVELFVLAAYGAARLHEPFVGIEDAPADFRLQNLGDLLCGCRIGLVLLICKDQDRNLRHFGLIEAVRKLLGSLVKPFAVSRINNIHQAVRSVEIMLPEAT